MPLQRSKKKTVKGWITERDEIHYKIFRYLGDIHVYNPYEHATAIVALTLPIKAKKR